MIARKTNTQTGFTLVELLIVIVVIAILAAISLVAYNGIQNGARNTALLSGFDSVEKALRMYKIENGHYPVPTDLPLYGGAQYDACINASLPAENGFAAGRCITASDSTYSESTVLDSDLKTVISQIPDTHAYSVSFGGDSYRGLLYVYVPSIDIAYLEYVADGDQPCGRGYKMPQDGMTVCFLGLE